MVYTIDIGLALGTSKTGLTLAAQVVDTTGGDVGGEITAGFVEIGAGNYLWHCTTMPDDHRGGVKFYEDGVPLTILAFGAINPEDAEYAADTVDYVGTSGVVVAAASKTGYSLAATGLDAIATAAPGGVADTWPEMVVQLWRRFFKKATMTATQVKTYADDGSTAETTQAVSDDGTTQTQGAAA